MPLQTAPAPSAWLLAGLFLTIPALGGPASAMEVAGRSSPFLQGRLEPLRMPEIEAAQFLLTFSEYPLGTPITTQYANQGVIFGGDDPFIASDSANPTSPVLSGSPTFQGAIEGRFVDPDDGSTPRTVDSFALDAGYFDALASIRLEWFDRNGRKLGQRASSIFGIERFSVAGGNIASWRIEIVENEPAGFAIDNLAYDFEISTSLLFRERKDGKKDGTWGLGADEIPGFDHVGLNVNEVVYESHPGNPAGIYTDKSGEENRFIQAIDGVQAEHSRGTFEHDAVVGEDTPVLDFEEVSIDRSLGEDMEGHIEQKIAQGATFRRLSFSTFDEIERTMSPQAQKGRDNAFTCVGLVEWAAERAGHNGGQGFIRNSFESVAVVEPGLPPKVRQFPLLSPQLLNYSVSLSDAMTDAQQWLQGMFDPVDFVITDPLGRRLGFTSALGELSEIPGAFFSGNGKLEQYFIPNPLPGDYSFDFYGLDQKVVGAMASSTQSRAINQRIERARPVSLDFAVDPVPGGRGDLDGDGDVDVDDRQRLQSRLNTFVSSFNDPADLDGDGVINRQDESLLSGICTRPGCSRVSAAACVGSANTLCLRGGRFRLEAEWRTPQGATGKGRAQALTDESGTFWFFDSTNVELIVKVINGCGLNDRFWVFSAGLTNVQVDLLVTDTLRGITRSYRNPLSVPYQPLQDTSAFDTCP